MHKKDSTLINPYLTFNGNCEEAMSFYKNVFNAELEIMRFDGSPVPVTDDYKSKVMHATLTFDDAILMASDGRPDQPATMGDAYSISIGTMDIEKATKWFSDLGKGGQVIMPFEKTFWGAQFGMLVDTYGVQWMINCELEAEMNMM